MNASKTSSHARRPGGARNALKDGSPEHQSGFVEPWVARCEAFAKAEGFLHFVFGLIVPRVGGHASQFVLTNYPREWIKVYDYNGYIRVDPVAARLLTGITPFAWDELESNTPKLRSFWHRAGSFGLRHGYTVPVHGPRGQHATLCLTGIDHPLPLEGRKELFERTWSFTVRLVEEIFGTYMQHDGATSSVPLTRKQREALTMIAHGRSIREIGEMLGLHARTVEYHLSSAISRLGASSREQAIVRALLSGDIEELSYPGSLRDWCLRVGSDLE